MEHRLAVGSVSSGPEFVVTTAVPARDNRVLHRLPPHAAPTRATKPGILSHHTGCTGSHGFYGFMRVQGSCGFTGV